MKIIIQKENEIKNDIIEAERKQMEEEIKKIKTEADKKKNQMKNLN